MKRVVLNYLITAAVVFSAAFTSSTSKVSGKLLESITHDNGSIITKFEYDEQNRIVKIYDGGDGETTKTIIYANALVMLENVYRGKSEGAKKFVINGNTVKVKKETLTINKEGFLASRRDPDSQGWLYEEKKDRFKPCAYLEKYEYGDGNLIRTSDNAGDGECFAGSFQSFEYDDKPSPFSNCNTPKWLLQYLLGKVYVLSVQGYGSKNNVIKAVSGGGDYYIPTVYKYEYDRDGFPTKLTIELAEDYAGDDLAGVNDTIIRFTYRGETKKKRECEEISVNLTSL